MNIMRSVSGESEDITEALRLSVYVDELRRQATIASRNITRAWLRAMQPNVDPHDTMVWGDLQSALFAAIVVYRMLKPGAVISNPKATKQQRQAQADHRAERLRDILKIDDNFAVFAVREVRNKFEHFDERLDALVLANRASFIDWHISADGTSFRTPEGHGGPTVEAMRVFYPKAGTLHFGDAFVDLYALDCALLTLRDEYAPHASKQLESLLKGAMGYGAAQYIYLVPDEQATLRMTEWLRVREEGGSAVAYSPRQR